MIVARGVGLVVGALFVASACSGSARSPRDAGLPPDADADVAPATLLGSVAAIVIPKCAVAGCHDAVSKTHSMDLSTADKIHGAWVGQRGFDHCTNLDTPRVIPGDADASLVVLKIEGVAVCLQSQRMPLPPREPLTAQEIGVIRAWIVAGAPSDRGTPDGGGDEAGGGDAEDAGNSEDGGPVLGCTASAPCGPEMICEGLACGEPWVCTSHFDDTREHPCLPETLQWCGCDGVTFEASITCPDRPYAHVGACGDGASCTKEMVRCATPMPSCPAGQVPSVLEDCWGACVPTSTCRCTAHWMCPDLAVNTCLPGERCGPRPPPTDAGTSDAL